MTKKNEQSLYHDSLNEELTLSGVKDPLIRMAIKHDYKKSHDHRSIFGPRAIDAGNALTVIGCITVTSLVVLILGVSVLMCISSIGGTYVW